MTKRSSTPLLPAFERNGYVVRFAVSDADLRSAQKLRHLCFVEQAGLPARADGRDTDGFDASCDHVLVEDSHGQVLGCFRVQVFGSGAALGDCYASQYYDLGRLSPYDAPMVELGRFCIHPASTDGNVVRMAWGMLAAFVDAQGAGMLFGCSSFEGVEGTRYRDAFDLLADNYLAPANQMPKVNAPKTLSFANDAKPIQDQRKALGQLPPLLKTYLTMGGWVSDHAVIDHEMNTTHVFTGLEIASIPPARAKALRAILG
ncbi:GNAT family N-acyltransferase [Octadecabacter sp. 1_MG-2023]|uniref:GNAT family N-acetyltransferase n=1 Tax=unclassified Octadecabacter TaxID=196158 RepID=UPI001C090D01|nr:MULTISPECIES: GNAT family N-acyltransferase [unclassified Octadecabacter]MBU2993609.1 GNAT family N-acetyltransferase [Octadecabacter sp. B2R22]MDO6735547.1 GNAT family N-acyltransferase [Octadecabacter sp. 1_MG-2023]